MILKNTVEHAGHTILFEDTSTGSILDEMLHNIIDILFIDITIPDLDAVTFIRHVKTQHPTTRIVVMGPMNLMHPIKNYLDYGADDFLEKPLQEEKILRLLKK